MGDSVSGLKATPSLFPQRRTGGGSGSERAPDPQLRSPARLLVPQPRRLWGERGSPPRSGDRGGVCERKIIKTNRSAFLRSGQGRAFASEGEQGGRGGRGKLTPGAAPRGWMGTEKSQPRRLA